MRPILTLRLVRVLAVTTFCLAAGWPLAIAAPIGDSRRPEAGDATHHDAKSRLFRGPSSAHRPPLSEAIRPSGADFAAFMDRVPQQDDPFAIIDGCVAQEITSLNAPGGAIGVMRDGQMVYAKGYGVKNRELGGAVDADTQFRNGSVNKMMTAAAIMQLVERRRVDLQAPVTRYVPEFKLKDPAAADSITVWNLLTHSSGIPDLLSGYDIVGPTTDDALGAWAAKQGEVRLLAPPGSFWNYTNLGYSLAGLVVERAGGMPYHQYMSHFWTSAGMTSTTLYPSEVISRGNYSYGHSMNPATGAPIIYAPNDYDNYWAAPAGFAFSTVGDLVHFADLLMTGGGNVIEPSSAAAMQAEQQTLNQLPGTAYGFGVIVEHFGDELLLSHGGNINGFGAEVIWFPAHRFAVATLVNTDGNLSNSALCAAKVLLQLPTPDPQDYSTSPDTWTPFTGHYHILDTAITWDRTSPRGVYDLEGQVTLNDRQLRLTFPELTETPTSTVPFSRSLIQAFLNTFIVDFNDNKKPDDGLDVTFITDPKQPGHATWMRDRLFVGMWEKDRLRPVLLPALWNQLAVVATPGW